jgi:dolichol kinase
LQFKKVYAKKHPMIKANGLKLHLRTEMHLVRKSWHLLGGLAIVYGFSMSTKEATLNILFIIFTLNTALEIIRVKSSWFNVYFMKVFGVLMRNSEVHRISGTPYYLASSLIAVAVFPKPVAILSILYLAIGDPISSAMGIAFGKDKIFENKSLQGSLAGFTVCTLITLVYFYIQDIYTSKLVIISLLGGMAGAIAEMLPLDLDDNFSIPIVSGFFVWLCIIASSTL